MVSGGWYAGYHSDDFPIASISWDKYTHLTYSFALTSSDTTQLDLDTSDAKKLPDFVKAAHQNNVKALLSIGGWGGSHYYSANVGNEANRTAFVKAITDVVTKYDLDGVDFDWEFPGAPSSGLSCNVVSAQDTTNYLSFLQKLRADPVGKKLILTAATSLNPWKGPDGTPLTDVSGFAKVLDWIEIMNYDVWGGTWSDTVGPNAPLNDTCTSNQDGSAVSAVASWQKAGMPLNQIVLGVPAYGHSFRVSKADAFTSDGTRTLNPFAAADKTNVPAGDKWDDPAGEDDGCGNISTVPSGDITFWGLIDGGYLNSNGTVAAGIDHVFDACSQTPFVYNEKTNVMISYDDATSFAAKGNFIKSKKLRGFALWEAGGDYHDILLDSIRAAVGFSTR
ncbi:Glycoside Hydrolase Family 18 protein [Trametes cinnabarina]|uniref:Glycoside Hydrolase Family 18 protein n=1 Tax=Pycnoporus cinnabarinus TaxID=5643 RepID=A0A060SPD3_PYCCI|nr:Glycoside Hydrolase Family 18 protein [Trametes cinnabarina]